MGTLDLFGDFFNSKRIETGLSLRKFCLTHNLDPGNISKIERGLMPPPQSKEKLEEYAGHLNIEKGSDDWYNFFDYAAACAGKIPDDVMNEEELVNKLPLIFRTLRGNKLNNEQLDELANLIRKS